MASENKRNPAYVPPFTREFLDIPVIMPIVADDVPMATQPEQKVAHIQKPITLNTDGSILRTWYPVGNPHDGTLAPKQTTPTQQTISQKKIDFINRSISVVPTQASRMMPQTFNTQGMILSVGMPPQLSKNMYMKMRIYIYFTNTSHPKGAFANDVIFLGYF